MFFPFLLSDSTHASPVSPSFPDISVGPGIQKNPPPHPPPKKQTHHQKHNGEFQPGRKSLTDFIETKI